MADSVTEFDSQQAVGTLTGKISQDARLTHLNAAQIQSFLGTWLLVYYTQRQAGLGHNAAITQMLAQVDQTVGGGKVPAPLPTISPEPGIFPAEDLVVIGDQLWERRTRVVGGREVSEPVLWGWRGVMLSQVEVPETLLAWAMSVGANIVAVPAPKDLVKVSGTLQTYAGYNLRVHWTDRAVTKAKPGTGKPAGDTAIALTDEAIATGDPLDAPNVVVPVRQMPSIKPGDISPADLFTMGAIMALKYGGGNLDIRDVKMVSEQVTIPVDTVQQQAEWFFKGLCSIPSGTEGWPDVAPGDGVFPLVWDSKEEGMGKVSGPQGVVILPRRKPDIPLQAAPGWTIDAVTGPGHVVIFLRR